MNYSETTEAVPGSERKKLITALIVLFGAALIFGMTAMLLRCMQPFWSVFAWIGSAMLLTLLVSKLILAFRDDFFRHKIIYRGILHDVRPVKVGYSTSASILYDLVLEQKTLKIGERGLDEMKLSDVPLPVAGEAVEVHCLPKSGDVIRLLVQRNGGWEEVGLK